MSPVFVAQSSVVFQKNFGHLLPTVILIVNGIVTCHVSVHFDPVDLRANIYAV